jgi:hypothetical protein
MRAPWRSLADAPTLPRAFIRDPCGGVLTGGVPHFTDLPQEHTFWRNVGPRGGPAPVRGYLPHLLDRVWNGHINPGRVFDLTLLGQL